MCESWNTIKSDHKTTFVGTGNEDAAAARVIQESGNKAYANTVLCGFDGNKDSAEAVKSGSITMTVAQMGFDMGYKSVEAAVDAIEGKELDSFIDSGSKVITQENVDDYLKYLEDPISAMKK